jgi:hypothetical protein
MPLSLAVLTTRLPASGDIFLLADPQSLVSFRNQTQLLEARRTSGLQEFPDSVQSKCVEHARFVNQDLKGP